MLLLGIDTDQYDPHCCPLTHVVTLSIDQQCMEIFVKLCTMSTLPFGRTAKPFKTFYESHHNTMYIHIAPELCSNILLIGGPDVVYETGCNFREESTEQIYNPEFLGWELIFTYAE